MSLTQLAYQILKQLSVSDIKIAAKDFGLSHYYFVQKIKSIDTDIDDLFSAVECMVNVHNLKDNKIKEFHIIFLNQYRNNAKEKRSNK